MAVASCQTDHLCPIQNPKGWASGLPTSFTGSRFQLWSLSLFRTERHLARRLKNNSFYPFTQQQPGGMRAEEREEGTWKGTGWAGPWARAVPRALTGKGAGGG